MAEPRIPLEPTHYYHIYNHAVGKENLFEREEDYKYFLSKMKEYLIPVTDILAYCLEPNHFHMVVRIKTKWYLMTLFYKKSTFISSLISEREQLIAEFDKAKNEYAASL